MFKSCITRNRVPGNVNDHLRFFLYKGYDNRDFYLGDPVTAEGLASKRAVQKISTGTYMYSSEHIAENFIFYANGKVLVATKEFSPILKRPDDAKAAWSEYERHNVHKGREEFYLTDKEARSLLQIAANDKNKAPEKQRVHILRTNKSFVLINKAITKHPLMGFLLRDHAKKFQEHRLWGGMGGYHNISIELLGSYYPAHKVHEGKTFARSAWYFEIPHDEGKKNHLINYFEPFSASELNYYKDKDEKEWVNLEAILEGVFESASFKVGKKQRIECREIVKSYSEKKKIMGRGAAEILAFSAWKGRKTLQQAIDSFKTYYPGEGTRKDANFYEQLRKNLGWKPEGARIVG